MSQTVEKVLQSEFPAPGVVGKGLQEGEVGLIHREEIVEVPVKVIREKFVECEPKIVEKVVEVPEIRIVEKIKEVKRVVKQEKIVNVPKIITEERIVEVPEYHEVEVLKEKIVVVPRFEDKVVERIVEVPHYVETPIQKIVDVPIKEEVNRRGVALYEVTVTKEYTVPTPIVTYEDVEVEIRLPKFVQVLPGQSKQSQLHEGKGMSPSVSKGYSACGGSHSGDNRSLSLSQVSRGRKINH